MLHLSRVQSLHDREENECTLYHRKKCVLTREERMKNTTTKKNHRWCVHSSCSHAHDSFSVWRVDEQCFHTYIFSFSSTCFTHYLFLETYTCVHFNLLSYVRTRDVWKRSSINVNHFVFDNMTAVCALNYFDWISRYISHVFLIGQKAKMSFPMKDIVCFCWQVYLANGHTSVFLI